ncbi:MAG TPA: hypothetical protein PLU49_09255 [Saprospiraceae bacterium]|nr:hypothetical protein [Saprospiraceae bacterium]
MDNWKDIIKDVKTHQSQMDIHSEWEKLHLKMQNRKRKKTLLLMIPLIVSTVLIFGYFPGFFVKDKSEDNENLTHDQGIPSKVQFNRTDTSKQGSDGVAKPKFLEGGNQNLSIYVERSTKEITGKKHGVEKASSEFAKEVPDNSRSLIKPTSLNEIIEMTEESGADSPPQKNFTSAKQRIFAEIEPIPGKVYQFPTIFKQPVFAFSNQFLEKGKTHFGASFSLGQTKYQYEIHDVTNFSIKNILQKEVIPLESFHIETAWYKDFGVGFHGKIGLEYSQINDMIEHITQKTLYSTAIGTIEQIFNEEGEILNITGEKNYYSIIESKSVRYNQYQRLGISLGFMKDYNFNDFKLTIGVSKLLPIFHQNKGFFIDGVGQLAAISNQYQAGKEDWSGMVLLAYPFSNGFQLSCGYHLRYNSISIPVLYTRNHYTHSFIINMHYEIPNK